MRRNGPEAFFAAAAVAADYVDDDENDDDYIILDMSSCPLATTPKLPDLVLTVVCSNFFIRDITPCSPLKVNRDFGGTCRPLAYHLLSRWFLAWLILRH
jgi:DeoR/GlpR family transcriptional regulator of sugar metabolism